MEHSLTFRRLSLFALVLFIAAPGIGQVEEQPYFSLSSARTFAPGEKASVLLSAFNTKQLEFRVYRVKDPVAFFESLDDPHMFGGRAPRPRRQRSLLERFHAWKREWRMSLVNTVRMQFDPDSRAEIRQWRAGRVRTAATPANYAEAPLLNKQQVVSVWRQKITTENRWQEQTIPLEITGKGVYLVEAVQGELRAYTIVMISDLAMIAKTSPGRVVAYVVNRESGSPVANCGVRLWSDKNKAQDWTTSDKGLIDRQVNAGRNDDLRLMAHSGEDFAVTTLSGYSLNNQSGPSWLGYIYTDRPVYRPGHTVDFKAILRLENPSGYTIPQGKTVQVAITGPDQKVIYQKDLAISRMGSVHDQLTLAGDAALGYYAIEIRQSDESMLQGGFQVEEYKKPEYEVRVAASKPRILQGESVQATINAQYYFGEPVKNAKVTYAIYRDRYWSPLFYSDDEEEGGFGGAPDEESVGQQISNQTGQLDDNGKLTITIPTTLSEHHNDFRYRIEARVTDEANREISGTGYFIATYGSFMVNAQPDQYVYTPGSQAKINIQARDYDNHPVRTAVKVELQTWRWNDPKATQTVSTTQAQTDAQGSGSATVTIPNGGEWRVRVTAITPENREVESLAYLWVTGGGAGIYGEQSEAIQIVPDKKTYQSGDTAKILIVTGVPKADVLVTIEGKQIRSAEVISANAPTLTFEVPVKSPDAPSFFVTASFIQKGKLHQGNKRVKVPPVEQKLNVQVTTSKPTFQPGETATYDLDVKDSAGRAVPNAEFSLGVVDEAIYAIRKDTTPDILQFFYGRQYNNVFTDNSLSYYFRGEAGKRRMRLAWIRSEPLAQLKPERLVQPKVRKVFPDTAYWNPDITTNAQGHAQVRFAFPDSLTTWRATARGITADTKAGSVIQKIIVRKNIIVRLAVPRFFTQGDEVTISAIAHNYLPNDKTAQVSLDVKGLDIVSGATGGIKVPSRGDAKLNWRVRAQNVNEAVLTGKALTDQESDAIELTIPIHPRGVKQTLAHGSSLSGAATQASASFTFPSQQVAPASRSIDIAASPSIAGALFGALDYLTSFPYGCTEQTMSSFLPNIIVSRALKDLKIQPRTDPKELQTKIEAGLERLYDFQHPDGGWGWWKTDESGYFMTAYVVAGLAQARDAGIAVNLGKLESGAVWLRRALQSDASVSPDLRAYAAYALALESSRDTTVLNQLWQNRSDLSPYGVALIGLAFDRLKDARAKDAASQLASSAKQNETEAWWPRDQDSLLDIYADATPEATAYALKLLARTDPQNPLLPKAALWLMQHRNEGFYWYSTKQTAMVIYGLTDYLKIGNELKPDFTATVYLNGKQVATKTFGAADALNLSSLSLHFDDSQVASTANQVRVEMKGTGRLYWSARGTYYSTEPKLAKTGKVALNILRDYYKLTPRNTGGEIVYDLNPLNGAVAPGDILAVRLTVTGGDWRYLMVEDPIPAGTEFIERDDLYKLNEKPPWWFYWFTRRELHDDRMAIFQTYFNQGQQQYFYLLKVVNPGLFQVNPAMARPMYQPEFLSTSESRQLEVK